MEPAAAHALTHTRSVAEDAAELAMTRLVAAFGGREQTPQLLEAALATNARLTLNFHPDRLGADRRSVAESLLHTGRYFPQAVTGLSNGGRFAVPGGKRNLWETQLFDGAYDGQPEAVRPVYGALDLTHDPFGGSPRFGSCFLVLEPDCVARSTFCVGDSHVGPSDVGTADSLTAVVAGLFEHAHHEHALNRGLTTDELLSYIVGDRTATDPARDLDGYVEAQVHGGIQLGSDVSSMVVDPSFRGTRVGDSIASAARVYGFELLWHRGSALHVDEIPTDFRGPAVVELARTIADLDGHIDAAAIGRSARHIKFTPPSIAGDTENSPLQLHKKLWHCVLHFGSPAAGQRT